MEADFVIIGSGSAGSAMAARLSEDGQHSVIVLEYGGSDAGPFIQMPGALSYPMNMPLYDWGYRSEPAAFGRAAIGLSPRQGDRWLLLHQWYGLCAWSCC